MININWLGKSVQNLITEDDSVISIGCGIFNDIKGIKCKSLTGFDIYKPYIDKLQKEGFNCINGDIITHDFSNECYDVVLALDVLEHIPQDKVEQVIEKLINMSKKRLILFTPAVFDTNEDNMSVLNTNEDYGYKGLGENQYQKHLSLISVDYLTSRGFFIKTDGETIFAVYDKNKVNVLIPHYNAKNTIDKTLNSVLSQSFKDFNIIIVDDCSNDGSYEYLVEKYSKNNKITIYRNDSNLGISRTKNKLMGYSDSEFVAWVASDDTWDKDFLSIMFPLAKKNKDKIIVCEYNIINEGDKLIRQHDMITNNTNLSNNEFREILSESIKYIDLPINYSAIIGHRFLFMGNLQFWDEIRTLEDLYHLMVCTYIYNINFIYVNKYLVNYRWHKDNTSHREDNIKMDTYNKILVHIENKIKRLSQ